MQTDEIEKLLPCPFCGGDASVWTTDAYSCDSAEHVLGCGECGIYMPFANVFQSNKPSESDRATWNTRTPDLAAEVVRLRKALEEILDLPDVDADNRSVIARAALEGRE